MSRSFTLLHYKGTKFHGLLIRGVDSAKKEVTLKLVVSNGRNVLKLQYFFLGKLFLYVS